MESVTKMKFNSRPAIQNKKTSSNYTKKGKKETHVTKKEERIFLGVCLGIFAAVLIFSYFKIGGMLTAVMAIGVLLIVGFAKLMERIRRHKILRRIVNVFIILFLVLALAACGGVAYFFVYIVQNAPEFDIERLNKREASILYDNQEVEVIKLGSELRENVTYDDLPEVFIDALIATEDSRYFQHNGFDAPRFIKASIGQVLNKLKIKKSNAGGASTITMQLAKNTYTDAKQSDLDAEGIIRKFTDIYIAVFKLEKQYTKEQIIEYYANSHELGSNAFGVEQASQTFFGKSVRDLNLSEAATLVGVFNNPTAYNPLTHPNQAESRRWQVLELMVKHGYITWDEANAAAAIPMTQLTAEKSKSSEYFYSYIEVVVKELKEKWGIDPYYTGVEIYTNMDRQKQQGIDDIFNGNSNFQWKDDKITAGVAVIDVDTGKIVAIGGGRDKTAPGMTINTATQLNKQIGSTAKPIFDYGPAIEYLGWSTYEQINDEPWTYSGGQSVNNSDRSFWGWMSMRTALAQSRNIPALKTFQQVQSQVGNKKILEFATGLGIHPEVQNGYVHEAHALGAFTTNEGTTPLQMAAAYAAFANGGTYYEPLTVNKIVTRSTGEVINCEGTSHRAMSDSTAFMITDMLITAVENGISGGAKVNGVTVAAKTGTSSYTDEDKKYYGFPGNAINDAWIVGYDPEYSIAMWYGYEKNTRGYYNTDVQAVKARGNLYNALGNVVFAKNGQTFQVPDSVVRVGVEVGSNPARLPSSSTPSDQITYEYFIKGTEPQEISNRYNKIATPTGLKVSYDTESEVITIRWNPQNTPTGNASYGNFGYNVYFGNVLLGFTTNTTYTLKANKNIEGTYKVTASFENYDGMESAPATFEFSLASQTMPTEDTYTITLSGEEQVSINKNAKYTDSENPVTVLKNGKPVSSSEYTVTTTIKSPSGTTVTEIDGTTTPLETGTYTITYTVEINGKKLTKTRSIIVS